MLRSFWGTDKTEKEGSTNPAGNASILREQANQVRQQIQLAEDVYNLLDDEVLTDALIYRIKALNLYYEHLLRLARMEGALPEDAGRHEERISEVMG